LGQKSDGELAILYEQFPGGHNVGYADGHVEWFATRDDVGRELKKGRP
jgi:prepilin-type processing-associated H-X9-DG protein